MPDSSACAWCGIPLDDDRTDRIATPPPGFREHRGTPAPQGYCSQYCREQHDPPPDDGVRRCDYCGTPLKGKRPQARYCDGRHKSAHHHRYEDRARKKSKAFADAVRAAYAREAHARLRARWWTRNRPGPFPRTAGATLR